MKVTAARLESNRTGLSGVDTEKDTGMSRTAWLLALVAIVIILVVVCGIYYSYWLKPITFLDSQRAFIQPKDFVEAESSIRTGFAQALTAVVQTVEEQYSS